MGAQLRVYRQKIKSAQTTKKITRAMELISASRIQKAQARVAASSPYARAITRAVSAVATYSNVEHVLTTEPEKIDRAAIVIFSSDRGLAGAFNSNVLKESEKLAELLRSQGKDVVYFLVGRKAQGYFSFRRRAFERVWVGNTDAPEYEQAKEVSDAILESFLRDSADGGVDEIHIIYNRFVSMLTQEPQVVASCRSRSSKAWRSRTARRSCRSTSSSPMSARCWTRCCRCTSRAASSTPCSSPLPPSTRPRRRR